MFHQIVGDGANLFLIIVAVIIGFIGAMAYADFVKVKKDQEQKQKDH